jgi:hypothetical protein
MIQAHSIHLCCVLPAHFDIKVGSMQLLWTTIKVQTLSGLWIGENQQAEFSLYALIMACVGQCASHGQDP